MRHITGVVVFLVMIAVAGSASSQMVVNDPVNLVQNGITALEQAEQVRQQVKEIQQQLEQLQLLRRDLESLSSGDLATLQATFRRLDELYNEANQISMEWGTITQEYDELYGDFDPEQQNRTDYMWFRDAWSEQTNNAIRSAMASHGVVNEYGARAGNLEGLLGASDGAGGTLAAIQAGNRMTAMLNQQIMELNEVIAADSRARLSSVREEQAQRETAGARAEERMLRDYGGSRPEVNISNSLPRMR